MHNRHFVISMTIEGEKVPAFSAITLNLPPIITDQTPVIVENSRSQYAASRGYVERYVNDRYLVQHNQPAAMQPTRLPQEALVPALDMPSVTATVTDESTKPKRKRKRNRKHKSGDSVPILASGFHELKTEGTIDLQK